MSIAPHLAAKTRLTYYIGNRIAISFDKVSDEEIEALIQVCEQELEQRKEKHNQPTVNQSASVSSKGGGGESTKAKEQENE